MPGMSQRQLHNLGINNALTTDSRTEVNNISDAATATTAVETFTINPCASDINLSSQEVNKFHLKATDEIPEKEKSHV